MDSCLLSSFQKIISLNKSTISIDDLPNGIVVDILSRLPVKTLILSTCVSKKWYFIIKSPSLISSHLSRSISNPSNSYIFLIHTILSQVNVFSDDHHRLIRHPDINLPFKTRSRSLKLIGACNGLICLTDHSRKYEGRDIYLLNPFINKYRKLVVDSSSYVDLIGEINDNKNKNNTVDIKVGFGYSEVENDYKVVRIIIRHSDINRRGLVTPKVEVYSIKTGKWKRVNVSIKISNPSHELPVFAHGCLYWHVHGTGEMDDYLLCFELKDEVFSKIKFPATYHKLNLSWDLCFVAKNASSVVVVFHTFGPNNSMKICLLVLEKKIDGEVYWKESKYKCAEFSLKKCLGFSSGGRLILNWSFQEYLVAIDLDNSYARMEKVALHNTHIDDYFYGATNVFESLVLFSD